MENVVVQQIVTSCVYRTLHANHFSRSSSQASLVLADLLTRYISLLTSTCARYAELSGRTSISAHDAIKALAEVGVGLDEIKEYADTEGRETGRYAVHTARRLDELLELKNFLRDGLPQERSTRTIRYMPIPPGGFPPVEEQEPQDVDQGPEIIEPLSPVSNSPSGSPSRKRRREDDEDDLPEKRTRFDAWDPPDEVPAHLPPFPRPKMPTPPATDEEPDVAVSQSAPPVAPVQPKTLAPPAPGKDKDKDKDKEKGKPSTPAPEPSASAPTLALTSSSGTADYRSSIPYEQSSLASVPEWHLPPSPPATPFPPPNRDIHRSLLEAYLYLLKDKDSDAQRGSTPARHRLTLGMMSLSDHRNEEQIFAVQPNEPRLSAQPPSYAKPLVAGGGRVSHPPTATRPAIPGMGVGVGEGADKLSVLAQRNVSAAIWDRVARMAPPPVQHRSNGVPSLYGIGVPAPWNAEDQDERQEKAKEPVLTPAEMWPTWPVEVKDCAAPLPKARVKHTR